MLKGRVYKSTGKHYLVKEEDGKAWRCSLKGKMKLKKNLRSSNPIAVGDYVLFDIIEKSEGIITQVVDRDNYLIRVSPQNRNQKHIISANLDKAIIIATLSEPKTSYGFIDRFIVSAEAYHIPVEIIVNKKDIVLNNDALIDEFAYLKHTYESIGYPVSLISAEQDQLKETLPQLLKDQTSLLVGHSGVGKSSIINKLGLAHEQRVQEVSEWNGKGKHTTTFAEMMDLPFGGSIIDTPGIKEFGILEMEQAQLSHYFVEMKAVINKCKFNNCLHINEPHCKVKALIEEGEIAPERYESYLSIYETLDRPHYL